MDCIWEMLYRLYPDVEFEHETHLVDRGLLAPSDLVALSVDIHLEFDVQVPEQALTAENFNSPEAIYALVERLVREDAC